MLKKMIRFNIDKTLIDEYSVYVAKSGVPSPIEENFFDFRILYFKYIFMVSNIVMW